MARTGQTRNECRYVMFKYLETSPLPRPRNRWNGTRVRMDLTEISGEDGTSLARDQNRKELQVLVLNVFETRSAFRNGAVTVS